MLLGETRDYRLTKLGSKLTFTAMSLHSDFVKKYIAKIDRSVRPSAYPLERGVMFEVMTKEVFGLYDLASGSYGQSFPDNCYKVAHEQLGYPATLRSKNPDFIGSRSLIKGYQKDLWIAGGKTGSHYPIEVKERRHGQGRSIFDYPDILVGKTENWDLKNNLTIEKSGYKGVLAMIIVCGYTGEIRVTSASLQRQEHWLTVRYGHETSYAVPTSRFASLETFIEHVRTL